MIGREALEQIFLQDVVGDVFGGAPSSPQPVTVWVGGQPGSGKTRAGVALAESLGEPGLCWVNGDQLRQYHPDFAGLAVREPLRMPEVTASAAGWLVGRCIAHANANGYSILLEGTWRDVAMVRQAVVEARSWGRRTHAVVVAVPPLVSRVATLERFYLGGGGAPQLGRWTPLAHHDLVVERLEASVRVLAGERTVERFTVVDRSGSDVVGLAWSDERANKAASAFGGEFYRGLRAEEVERLVGAQPLIAMAHERAGIVESDAVRAQGWLFEVASRLQREFSHVRAVREVRLVEPRGRVLEEVLQDRAAASLSLGFRGRRLGPREMGDLER